MTSEVPVGLICHNPDNLPEFIAFKVSPERWVIGKLIAKVHDSATYDAVTKPLSLSQATNALTELQRAAEKARRRVIS